MSSPLSALSALCCRCFRAQSQLVRTARASSHTSSHASARVSLSSHVSTSSRASAPAASVHVSGSEGPQPTAAARRMVHRAAARGATGGSSSAEFDSFGAWDSRMELEISSSIKHGKPIPKVQASSVGISTLQVSLSQ